MNTGDKVYVNLGSEWIKGEIIAISKNGDKYKIKTKDGEIVAKGDQVRTARGRPPAGYSEKPAAEKPAAEKPAAKPKPAKQIEKPIELEESQVVSLLMEIKKEIEEIKKVISSWESQEESWEDDESSQEDDEW